MQAQPTTVQQLVRMPETTPSPASAAFRALRPWSVRRANVLVEASERLAASLDLETTLRCMTDLTVPRLGDACLIYLLDDGLALSDVIVKHVDPGSQQILATLARPASPNMRGWQ